MKLALIPPASLLEHTNKTTIQLMLPQQLISDYTYRRQYIKHCKNPEQYVILDNGAAEADQISEAAFADMILTYKPQEAALPDTLADGPHTLTQAEHFFSRYDIVNEATKFGFVAQGRSIDQCMETVSLMEMSWWGDHVSVIYLPRLLIKEAGDHLARIELVAKLNAEYGSRFEYHFFGSSPLWHAEIRVAAELPFVRSMDTSLPYILAYHKKQLEFKKPNVEESAPLTRPDNYFDKLATSFDGVSNILKTYIDWSEGKN